MPITLDMLIRSRPLYIYCVMCVCDEISSQAVLVACVFFIVHDVRISELERETAEGGLHTFAACMKQPITIEI